jgi:hypothetical protein
MMAGKGGLPFKLPAAAFRDIAQLTDLADRLKDIAKAAELLVSDVPFQDYVQTISRNLNVEVESVASVITAFRGLRRLQQSFDLDPDELIKQLTTSLEKDAKEQWKSQYWDRWTKSGHIVAEVLELLVADHPLVLLWKSELLAGAHENLLGESVILTDIRPVFNQAGDKVVQTVVSHTLLVDYLSGQDRKRIQFTLDAADITDLKDACERAKRKSDAIRASLSQLSWPTSVPRDARD